MAGCIHTQVLKRILRDLVDNFYGAGGAQGCFLSPTLICLLSLVQAAWQIKWTRKQHGESHIHYSSLQQV